LATTDKLVKGHQEFKRQQREQLQMQTIATHRLPRRDNRQTLSSSQSTATTDDLDRLKTLVSASVGELASIAGRALPIYGRLATALDRRLEQNNNANTTRPPGSTLFDAKRSLDNLCESLADLKKSPASETARILKDGGSYLYEKVHFIETSLQYLAIIIFSELNMKEYNELMKAVDLPRA
jgi:hypothetical protein